jgi:hypothetical protein
MVSKSISTIFIKYSQGGRALFWCVETKVENPLQIVELPNGEANDNCCRNHVCLHNFIRLNHVHNKDF